MLYLNFSYKVKLENGEDCWVEETAWVRNDSLTECFNILELGYGKGCVRILEDLTNKKPAPIEPKTNWFKRFWQKF